MRRGIQSVAAGLLAGLACSAAPHFAGNEEPETPPTTSVEALGSLEREVREERARLVDLISAPATEGAPALRESEELRRIARQLPLLQNRLEALRESLGSAPPRARP
jgi:hypothetical protein